MKKKSINIYEFAIVFYILMTLLANNLIIPSYLCTIAIVILILSTIVHVIQTDQLKLKKNKYLFFFWYMFFSVVSVAAIVYSPNKNFISESSYLLYTSLILLFCFCTLIDSYSRIILVMKSYEWGSAVLFLILIFTGNMVSDERLGSSFTNNSNTFALFMMIAFFFTSWQFLYYEQKRIQKYIAGIVMIMNTITILFSGARKIIVACMLYIIILELLKKDKKGRKHIIGNIIIIFIVIFIVWKLMMGIPVLYNIVGNRMESLVEQFLGNKEVLKGSSAYLRSLYRKLALKGWLASPLWGHGYDSFRFYNKSVTGNFAYSHNNFTELLYNIGIIGTVIFYSMHLKLLKKGLHLKNLSIKAITLGGVVGLLLCDYGQVDYNLIIIMIFLFSLYKLNELAKSRD